MVSDQAKETVPSIGSRHAEVADTAHMISFRYDLPLDANALVAEMLRKVRCLLMERLSFEFADQNGRGYC